MKLDVSKDEENYFNYNILLYFIFKSTKINDKINVSLYVQLLPFAEKYHLTRNSSAHRNHVHKTLLNCNFETSLIQKHGHNECFGKGSGFQKESDGCRRYTRR